MGTRFWQWSFATVQEHHFSCQSGRKKRHNIHIHWRNDTPPLHYIHAVTPRIHTLSPTSTLHLKLVPSLLYFCSFLRHRKYVQCITVVFSSRCHGSTVCFRHSDRDYCHNLASVMTGFREKRSICRGSEGTLCWNYITCVAMLRAPPCYFRPILQLLCVIHPNEFSHFISSFTLSFASKNTSKHAQKRCFWRHCETEIASLLQSHSPISKLVY